MELKKINEDIYYLEHEKRRDRPVLGYVLGEKFSVMIDCGNSENHLMTFLGEIKKRNLPYPKYAIVTHWHWDHSFAMSYFNGDIILSELTNNKLMELEMLKWDEESVRDRVDRKEEIDFAYRSMKEEYDDFSNISLDTGDIIYDRKLTLDMGNKSCEIIKVGGPHEEDSSIVYIKEDRILFAGDAHSGDYYKADGKIDSNKMRAYIEVLENLNFDYYIPGHDSPLKKNDIINLLNKYC